MLAVRNHTVIYWGYLDSATQLCSIWECSRLEACWWLCSELVIANHTHLWTLMQLMPFFLSSLFINIFFFPFIFPLSGSGGSLVNVLTFIHWLTDQAITFSLWCSCQACIMSRFSLLIFLRFYSGSLQQKYSTGIKLINLRSILTVRLTGHSKDLESDPTSHPSPLFRTNAGHLTTVDDFLCRVPWEKKSESPGAPRMRLFMTFHLMTRTNTNL